MRALAWLLMGFGALFVGFFGPLAFTSSVTIGLIVGAVLLLVGATILRFGGARDETLPGLDERRHRKTQTAHPPTYAARLEPLPEVAAPSKTPYPQPLQQGTPVADLGKPKPSAGNGRQALIAFVALAAILALLNECARSAGYGTNRSASTTVSASDAGMNWPFRNASTGLLTCEMGPVRSVINGVTMRPLVTITLNDRRYALNGAAMDSGRFPDVRQFLPRNEYSIEPVAASGVSALIQRGLSFCEKL